MLEKLKNTYKGKKVFLTGHTGFKGSWLLKILVILGADVRGFALEPKSDQDLYNLINGDSICESTIGDLRDRKKLIDAILDFEPDFVFHLAAQPLVRLSYEIPSETFEINAIGTANLLDAIHLLNKPCTTVMITTDKVYHNNEWEYPYRENDRLGGYDPYSASKACAELVIDCYRNSFFNLKDYHVHQKSIGVARAGNVIGGGDWSENRLIPDIAKAFTQKKPVVIRNPDSVRPWQHVLEPLYGYLLLGAKLVENPKKFSQEYNFGPQLSDALPVKQMLELAIKSWKAGSYVIEKVDGQPHEAGLLKLDISKTIAELKWKPKMIAQQAVSMTMDWYNKFNSNKEEIDDFTLQQINTFFDE